MRRLAAGVTLGAVLAGGCAPLEVERRTERGPLLRTYTRQTPLGQHTVAGHVEARWPRLQVRLVASEVCRTEVHEEYAEEVIIERSAPSAAPAASSGAANVLLGGGLLLARPLFSAEPDRDAIDREGRYGTSNRQVATGFGVALLALGVPSLITGVVQLVRSGDERELTKVDTVASLREAPCQPRPAQGLAQWVGRGPEGAPRLVQDGTLELSAAEVGGAGLSGLLLDGAPVTLSEGDEALLAAFSACAALEGRALEGRALEAEALAGQSEEALWALRAQAVRCAQVPGAPAQRWLQALDEALAAQAPAPREGPRYESFEDALARLKPALRVTAGSPGEARLREARGLEGQPVVLVGLLVQRLDPDTAVVEVGETRVRVLLDPARAWAADFARGSRVELVGVVEGVYPLGGTKVPRVRAAWMRPAL